MSGVVKAVVIREPGGPERLQLVDQPLRDPGPDEVVIRTKAMAVSRADVLIRKGVYAWMPPLPASPGNELTGVIEDLGGNVQSLRRGDAVLLSARDLPVRGGCYAEAVCVPADAVYRLPQGMGFDEAVVLPTYLVAYAMYRNAGGRAGAKAVFISGVSGSIGNALSQLAKADGLRVIGTAGSPKKAEHARRAGVDHVINYKTENVVQRVLELTDGRGTDLAFDHIIGPRFADLFDLVADFGTLTFFNIHAAMPEEDVFRKMCALSTRSLTLSCFNIHTYDHHVDDRRRLMKELIDLLAAGAIRPHIGARLTLRQAAQAHALLEAGSVEGKIILAPDL